MTDVLRVPNVSPAGDDYVRLLGEIERTWVGLADKPEENPATTLRALWFAAAGQSRSVQRALDDELPPLGEDGRERLAGLVERRLAGVPLAHLTGRQSFMGLELLAGPEALIPRKETELLGFAALNLLRQVVAERGGAVAIDICTGSGNLALALAHLEPSCQVVGGDLSGDALSLARRNAERAGLTDRVRFVRGDLFEPFDEAGLAGRVDVVVCNPPYISTAKAAGMPTEIAEFEPRLAFDGGAFGIAILFRLVAGAPRFLKPASWLCVEVGAGQGEPMAARLERAGSYAGIERVRDAGGEVRALLARTKGPSAVNRPLAPSVR